MQSTTDLHCHYVSTETTHKKKNCYVADGSRKTNKKILKTFLLAQLYELIRKQLNCHIDTEQTIQMECYVIDNKIIQFLINSIIETNEYTLEGISFYTRIPFEVIYDAACGLHNQFTITTWASIINLYMQVKPDIMQRLVNQLLEIKEINNGFLMLLKTSS